MTPVLSSLLDASIRISLVAVLVTALVYGFRVRSSSLRHKAWLSVLAAMLLMPVMRGSCCGLRFRSRRRA